MAASARATTPVLQNAVTVALSLMGPPFWSLGLGLVVLISSPGYGIGAVELERVLTMRKEDQYLLTTLHAPQALSWKSSLKVEQSALWDQVRVQKERTIRHEIMLEIGHGCRTGGLSM